MTNVDNRKLLKEPPKAYGPIAKVFVALMGVMLAAGGLAALWSRDLAASLGLLGLSVACFFALARGREIHEGAPQPRTLKPCPCCGVTVLDARVPDQSCLLCEWEVGEDSDNLGYTLEQARANFRRYSTFYTPDDLGRWGGREITDHEVATKHRIMETLAQLHEARDRNNAAKLWIEFERLEHELLRLQGDRAGHGT